MLVSVLHVLSNNIQSCLPLLPDLVKLISAMLKTNTNKLHKIYRQKANHNNNSNDNNDESALPTVVLLKDISTSLNTVYKLRNTSADSKVPNLVSQQNGVYPAFLALESQIIHLHQCLILQQSKMNKHGANNTLLMSMQGMLLY